MVGDFTPVGPTGYHTFYSDPLHDQGRHGGSDIFVRRDVPFSYRRLAPPFQAVAVEIYLKRRYTVCSLYLLVERGDVDRLVPDHPAPFLLQGDFNGRHPLWSDCITNPRGVLLASLVENEELAIFNSEEMTHFHSQTGLFTAIDLSLCSSTVFLAFNWKVLTDLHGSDPFPIILTSAKGKPRTRLHRWRIERADWQIFTQLCSTARIVDTFGSTDEAPACLSAVVHSAATDP